MFMKILAASAFTVALATSAMAQSAGTNNANGGGNGQSVTVDPNTPASPNTVDPSVTNSTTGMPGSMNSNADQNCPSGPQGAQADANGISPGTTAPTVNDNNCGK